MQFGILNIRFVALCCVFTKDRLGDGNVYHDFRIFSESQAFETASLFIKQEKNKHRTFFVISK